MFASSTISVINILDERYENFSLLSRRCNDVVLAVIPGGNVGNEPCIGHIENRVRSNVERSTRFRDFDLDASWHYIIHHLSIANQAISHISLPPPISLFLFQRMRRFRD